MSETPGLMPDSSAAQQASSVIYMKARALRDNEMHSIRYEMEVEDQYGNKVKEKGTILASEEVPPIPPGLLDDPEEGQGRGRRGFFGRG